MFEVCFALVRVRYPTNVGAAARAIKAMGFSRLMLIAPEAEYHAERAFDLATFAGDVLRQVEVRPSLEEVVREFDLVVGTSNKSRNVNLPYVESGALKDFLEARQESTGKVLILFGEEASGLHNEELELCQLISGIPTAGPKHSLNLAQAVMVYAYALSELSGPQLSKVQMRGARPVASQTMARLLEEIGGICSALGLDEGVEARQQLVERLRTISDRDYHLARRLVEGIKANDKSRDHRIDRR